MYFNRIKAKLTGILLISGMVAGILSIAPSIDAPDFLIKASENSNQVIIGAFFQFIMSITYLGVAIVLYPILRKYNDILALGFLSFRIIGTVLNIIGTVFLLLILTLSQEFSKAVLHDSLHFQILGDLLRMGRDLVNHVFMILALSVGGLMLYVVLFRTRLIPRWLSVWGLLGTTSTMIASLFVLFHSIDIITPVYFILNTPIALLEIILAIWLIVKGFDQSVIISISDKD